VGPLWEIFPNYPRVAAGDPPEKKKWETPPFVGAKEGSENSKTARKSAGLYTNTPFQRGFI